MAASSSLARFQGGSSESALETIEIDPQFAGSLGLHLGDVVSLKFTLGGACLKGNRSR